jgi:hypothetical protein
VAQDGDWREPVPFGISEQPVQFGDGLCRQQQSQWAFSGMEIFLAFGDNIAIMQKLPKVYNLDTMIEDWKLQTIRSLFTTYLDGVIASMPDKMEEFDAFVNTIGADADESLKRFRRGFILTVKTAEVLAKEI